ESRRDAREPEYACRVARLLDPLEDSQPLHIERVLVEMGVSPGVSRRAIGLERAGQIVALLRSFASIHACSPSVLRNFRSARNKCTRTVAGLIPVAAAISAGVRSSTWLSVNTSRGRSGSAATAS